MTELRSLRYFVAVADAGNVHRAATALNMSQPPLTRALRQLETELGARLFVRTAQGMTLTDAGAALLPEARTLLRRADALPDLITRAAGAGTLVVGTLAGSLELAGGPLLDAFGARYPNVGIRVVEAALADPTAGVRNGTADVALTRGPLEAPDISVARLGSEPVGVLLRADDPLAGQANLRIAELADRRWFRLPESADPLWRAFWCGGFEAARQGGPVVGTIRECVRAVRRNDAIGLVPVTIGPTDGLVVVPVLDWPASPLLVVWRRRDHRSLVRGFVDAARAISDRSSRLA